MRICTTFSYDVLNIFNRVSFFWDTLYFVPQVIALSVFLLKERCGVFRFLAALVLVIGVVLIAKPPMIFGQNEEVVRT